MALKIASMDRADRVLPTFWLILFVCSLPYTSLQSISFPEAAILLYSDGDH